MPRAPKRHRAGPPKGTFKSHSEQTRGSASERGYTWRWHTYTVSFKAAHPWCVRHLAIGRVVPTEHVDHIERVDGPNDPRFWNEEQHQGLCASCHSTKTDAENRGARFTIEVPWPAWPEGSQG